MSDIVMEVMKCKGCGEDFERKRARGPYCEACSTVSVSWGYTRAELSEAFDRVKSPENWKLPIDAMLPGRLTPSEKTVIEAAVVFYAGCSATFSIESENHGRTVSTRVRAAGYYAAVGA